MKIPSHYRQLNPDEVIRRGDLWQTVYGSLVGRVRVSIGKTPQTHSLSYTYWRRRHVAVSTVQKPVEPQKQQHPVEKNPLVRFSYPSSQYAGVSITRDVRVIGANNRYIIGVQVNGKKAAFKKFRRDKISDFRLVEFNPLAVS